MTIDDAVRAAARGARDTWAKGMLVNEFIGSFKHAKLLRGGYAPPPPEGDHARHEHDYNLSRVLLREFVWKHPKWVPHTVAEERLLVGCLFALKAAGWGVGEHCWAAVIEIHGGFRNTPRAEQAFRMMQRDALITPSSISYGKLMTAYSKEPNLPKLKLLWRSAIGHGILLTPECYAAVMNCFALLDLRDHTWDTFRYVVARKRTPITPKLFGPLFRLARSPKEVRKVLALIHVYPTAWLIKYHVSYALEGVARGGLADDTVDIERFRAMVSETRDLLARATRHDPRLLRTAFQWILPLQSLAKDVNYFTAMLDCMKDTVTDLPSNACIKLTRHCVNVNCVATAEAAFGLIPEPKASTFAVLLSLYVQNKMYDRVGAVWNAMKARRIAPNRLCYALYIQACGDRCSSTDDAYVQFSERLFREAMEAEHHLGDLFLWAMLMRVYWKVGDAKKARGLDRERRRLREPKGKLYAGYFRDVSPGPTPAGTQVWEDLIHEVEPELPPDAADPSDAPPQWHFEDLEPVDDEDGDDGEVHSHSRQDADGAGLAPATLPVDRIGARRRRIRSMAWGKAPPVEVGYL